jgi:DNA-binding CsgD family transcriptional regulator
MTAEISRDEVQWLDQWSGLLASSSTISEMGKKLVHSKITHPSSVGCHFFLVDNQGGLGLAGGYGLHAFETTKPISVWEDNLLSISIQQGTAAHSWLETEHLKLFAVSIPIIRNDEPIGAMLYSQREGEELWPSKTALSLMGTLLSVWLEALGLAKTAARANTSTSEPEPLTDRQLEVLELMALGKTNAEIASELILSESSIRQETVRIYRALGVGTRSEAAKRANHLGLLSKKIATA